MDKINESTVSKDLINGISEHSFNKLNDEQKNIVLASASLEKQKKQMFFIYMIFLPIWNVMISLPRSEVKFSDSTVHRLKGAHLLHKMTANAARQMRLMPSWEIL